MWVYLLWIATTCFASLSVRDVSLNANMTKEKGNMTRGMQYDKEKGNMTKRNQKQILAIVLWLCLCYAARIEKAKLDF